MDWIQALILGVIQGITEFLPISSSGHLVLSQHLLNIKEPGILIEIALHFGTLVAIIFYYHDDLSKLEKIKAPSRPTAEKPTINKTLLIPTQSTGVGSVIIVKVIDIQKAEGIINPA